VTAARPSAPSFSRYSSASALKVSAAAALASRLAAFFCADGSPPAAGRAFAASRDSRAAFRLTAG